MKKIFRFLLILLASLSIITCDKKSTNESSSYVKENTTSISELELDNGIKLIVKKHTANRIRSIDVRYRGGNALTPEGKDGIEALTLSTMQFGSQKYSRDDIESILHENSSNMGSGTSLDMAWLTFNTIDKYWETASDVFFDCIINPSFKEEDFAIAKKNAESNWTKRQSDQYELTVDKLMEKSRAGHPYGKQTVPTTESLNNISLDDVKNWYTEKLTADRMFIVAVGDFDPATLKDQLNKTLGKIVVKNNEVPTIPAMDLKNTLYTHIFPTADGSVYMRGDYEIPDRLSPDFIKLHLAYSILDDLLFSIVRTDHAACYSVWCGIHGFNKSYGSLVIYRTAVPSDGKRYFDEAIALLASGKTLKLKPDETEEKYAPISETLEAYKAKYINRFFSGQYTNASIASQIAYSYYYEESPTAYLNIIDEINAITADDIVRVINEYLVNAKISWIVVSDETTLNAMDKSVFEGFTGKVQK